MPKVTVAGAGYVGRTTAMRLAQWGRADICLVDIIEGWPQGLALDMRHSAPIEGFAASVTGTNDYADTASSDVVVVTAGLPRGPGMSRLDLLEKNAAVVKDVCRKIAQFSPEAIVIVVTNPLDEMTHLAALATGFPRERVMGMAGVLDSARLAVLIAEELNVSPLAVEAITLGSHGEQMVPLARHARVQGKPLVELLDEQALERIYGQTVNAGAEIVKLMDKASAFYAPSAAAAKMVKAVLAGSDQDIPVCAWVQGQYGIRDVYLGVPVRLGPGGVEKIIEYDLDSGEISQLQAAAEAIAERCKDLGELAG